MTEIIVYTALFGDYDNLPVAPYGGTIFTDQPSRAVSRGWDIMHVPAGDSPARLSRFYFINSTSALPDTTYTIMHGANSRLVMSPLNLVTYLGRNDIAAFPHPHRQTVYQEAEACIAMRKDDPDIIRAQMARYRAEGFPEDYPLSACILLVRRNTPALRNFEQLWWGEVVGGSVRDQLSFDYCRWRLGIDVTYIPLPWREVFYRGKHKHG